ncbi:MAG: 16S rRNA (cytosine(1402)-N(4))-methyltransferase RsmH [Actinomycetota bacterium]
MTYSHVPVMAEEVRDLLGPALVEGGPLVDCTVGGGGHSAVFLEQWPELSVVGIDRDREALAAAGERLARFGNRVLLVHSNFSGIAEVVRRLGHEQVAAILYDLGVSSVQLDRADRGFGYRSGFALDMRMDRSEHQPASDIVNNYSEKQLIDILFRFGEERFARRIARAIVSRRARRPFSDGGDLAEVVKTAIPAATRRTGPHPARRTFQALRIETNRELEALDQALASTAGLLRTGGRIAVISYHSLEDRIVKESFRSLAQGCVCPREVPICVCGRTPELRILTRKPVRPGELERAANPRSDSARLRVAERLAEAA